MEEGTTRLLEALESRADALVGRLRHARVQQQAQRTQLDALERHRVGLEASNAELAARVQEAEAERDALAARLAEQAQRLSDLEATRRELAEENRELEAQNRELEAHNARLRDQVSAPSAAVFQPHGRRTRGLSALIGHRLRHDDAGSAEPSPPEPKPSEPNPPEETPPATAESPVAPAPAGEPAAAARSRDEAPSPQALLGEWYRRYDATFFKGHTRPLKVGIHKELAAREPWPEKLVRRALACYVNLPRYLKSLREGAERIDLAGAPAGRVDAAAAEHARKKLERLQADRRQGPAPGKARADDGRAQRAGKADAERRRPASDASRPSPVSPESPREPEALGREPATLEEKLHALVAKHSGH